MIAEIKTKHYTSPYGEIIIGEFDSKICLIDWAENLKRKTIDHRLQRILKAKYVEGESELMNLAFCQLMEYFKGERKEIDVPYIMAGSDFQKKIWCKLQTVPYGGTITFDQLGQMVGKENVLRTIAATLGSNALAVIVPTHRMVGATHMMVNYGGGAENKKRLMDVETGGEFSRELENRSYRKQRQENNSTQQEKPSV